MILTAAARTVRADDPHPPVVVVMGVQGSGKSTVGRALAEALAAEFVDGDDLHPAANRAKMAAGIPLDDLDRAPWLRIVGERLARAKDARVPLVVACSALKRGYRDQLRAHAPGIRFVHLAGSRDVLLARIAGRSHEFMPPTLLDSQLATLEPLNDRELGITVDVDRSVDDIVGLVVSALEPPDPLSAEARHGER